jgi:hypothetical protein
MSFGSFQHCHSAHGWTTIDGGCCNDSNNKKKKQATTWLELKHIRLRESRVLNVTEENTHGNTSVLIPHTATVRIDQLSGLLPPN